MSENAFTLTSLPFNRTFVLFIFCQYQLDAKKVNCLATKHCTSKLRVTNWISNYTLSVNKHLGFLSFALPWINFFLFTFFLAFFTPAWKFYTYIIVGWCRWQISGMAWGWKTAPPGQGREDWCHPPGCWRKGWLTDQHCQCCHHVITFLLSRI